MKEKRFLDKSQPSPIIRFPERVVPKIFDDLLTETYRETLYKKTAQVEFDFSRVAWCDIFELSLISLWILELASAGKQITFRFPNDKHCFQFLITYRFDVFLQSHNVNREIATSFRATAGSTELVRAPFYPLTFSAEEGLKNILSDLNYGDRLEIVLGDVKDTEVVRTGAIRDVILKELIDNMIVHGGARFAYVIMTKLGGVTDLPAYQTRSLLNNVSEIEKGFFRSLSGKPFLALVIGDKGDGISSTLKPAYISDEIIGPRSATPTDDQILEYAFLYHSTRRSIKERLGEIKNVISQEALTYPPPTGLFRLKEKVREFSGFLYVRSGTSILAYDFYNQPHSDRPLLASQMKSRTRIANLGGTQYKIYFPIDIPRSAAISKPFPYAWSRRTSKTQYTCLFVRKFGFSEMLPSPEQEASQLIGVFREIDRIAFTNKGKSSSVILDFQGERNLSAKALHYLLFGCMQRQNSNFSIVATNVNIDSEEWQLVFDRLKPPKGEKTPLLVFDEKFARHFFGATSAEIDLIEALLSGKLEATTETDQIVERYDHLLIHDDTVESFHSNHTMSEIIEATREATKTELSRTLLSPSEGVFSPDIKVLLPSNRYCKGFFEINKLLSDRSSRTFLRSWYVLWLIQLKPDFVISLSRHMGDFVDEAIDALQTMGQSSIEHVNLRTPTSELDLVRLSLRLERGKTGIVISEVLGSGDTLNRVLEKTQHTNVIKIMPVINASEQSSPFLSFKGKDYPVEALMMYPLSYHLNLPQGWLYSEIQQVDPNEHLLIQPSASLDGPLWRGITISSEVENDEVMETYRNEFLVDCVLPTSAFLEGHFTNQEQHLTVLFNMPVLVGYFSEEIVELITNSTKSSLGSILPSREITHIMYLSRNPGMETLANLVSARFDKSVPVPVSTDEFWARFDSDSKVEEIDGVIIIDDAIVSGESIFKMYDIAEDKGAKHIFAYVIIKRGTDHLARRFEKTSEYGHAKLQARYLTDVEIPSYSPENCPVCDRLEELEYLQAEVPDDGFFSAFIDGEIDKLAEVRVELMETEQIATLERALIGNASATLTLRWTLELAKKKLAPRKELDYLVRRHVDAPKDVLRLFQVIFREQRGFLQEEKVREAIFYETFAAHIVEACRYFLGENTSLEEEEFEAVICLLMYLDEEFRVDQILDLFRRSLIVPKQFLRLLTQVLLGPLTYQSPGRMARMFRTLLGEVTNNDAFETLLGHIVRYCTKKEDQLIAMQNDRLSWFRSLTGGLLHETGHLKDTVIGQLEQDSCGVESIIKSWTEFHEHVFTALPLLRRFSANHLSSRLSDQLNANVLQIELHLKEAKRLASLFQATTTFSERSDLPDVQRQLKRQVSRLFALISGPRGTNVLLRSLETNIKTVAFTVAQQQREDLNGSKVTLVREFPEGACTVFGEYTFIIQAFQNLVENVWKNSGAQLLKIKTVIHDDEDMVDIQFLDNGKGITKPFLFGEGLKVVNRNALASCGAFDIRNLAVDELEYALGFRTVATLTLPLLQREA